MDARRIDEAGGKTGEEVVVLLCFVLGAWCFVLCTSHQQVVLGAGGNLNYTSKYKAPSTKYKTATDNLPLTTDNELSR